MYMCIYMYIDMHISLYIYIYVYMYIYMYMVHHTSAMVRTYCTRTTVVPASVLSDLAAALFLSGLGPLQGKNGKVV